MNQQAVCIALASVALFAVVSAEHSPSVKANLAILTAKEGQQSVGFEATQQALREIHEELEAKPRDQFDFADSVVLEFSGHLLNVCEPKVVGCEKNEEVLSLLMHGETSMTANLLPYMRECKRRHDAICA